ncbi:sigma-54 dependent transcriptional regulator [bacterium]|nr:sigma-54 dependent transcriptional regulator [bacterium]
MRILIVDDDKDIRDFLSYPLTQDGHVCFTAKTGAEAYEILNKEYIQICFLDYKLPDTDGLSILETIKNIYPNIVTILITGQGSIDLAKEAIRQGAYDFVEKPFEFDHIEVILQKAEKEFFQHNKVHYLEEKLNTELFDSIIGNSKKLKQILQTADKIAEAQTFTVLIEGASGTGKELIAQYLRNKSNRSQEPFIEINCAAIPEHLLESELFGYEAGAFTGANETKRGLFEEADQGILFLDEIGEMPLKMQVKLLRTLESRTIRRLGSEKVIPINIALITATNKNLQQLIKDKKFREDLYYRLNVIRIQTPSLLERQEDIPLLIDYFIHKFNTMFGKHIKGIEVDALEVLYNYSFPGNIRELKNIIERAMLMENKEYLSQEHFKYLLPTIEKQETQKEKTKSQSDFGLTYHQYKKKLVQDGEKEYLKQLLQKNKGIVNQAAKQAGIHRTAFSKMLTKYGISFLDYKE